MGSDVWITKIRPFQIKYDFAKPETETVEDLS